MVVLTADDDLRTLVRDAVAGGADALGMAGGDGSLALVAAAAAASSLAFVPVPAGTRNHFARDAGIDPLDVVGTLGAFGDGVERSIDIAEVNGRSFLNNVSLGLSGEAVQRPEYRGAKVRTVAFRGFAKFSQPTVAGRPTPSPRLDSAPKRTRKQRFNGECERPWGSSSRNRHGFGG